QSLPVAPQTNTIATEYANEKPSAVAALPAQIQPQNTSRARRVTYREAASVIANPETGIISVRATARQHASVREFIDKVTNTARRQVLIEATIVEVSLNDQYQQGIDWSLLSTIGLSLTQVSPAATGVTPMATMGTINFANPGTGKFNLSGAIKLLENFGKLHVLSSPKLSVLNNQTGLVKAVDEHVYFTIEVTQGTINPTTGLPTTLPTYTSTVHTVPVGVMMYVTPQIGGDAEVTLNLRPTITRILSYANDPNPALIDPITHNKTLNLIPQIQTREMESILRVRNGDIAVLGGLMQDTRAGDTSQIPGLGSIPVLGELFKARTDRNDKSELVIFLRPVILNQESQYDLVRQFKDPTASAEWQKATNQAEVTP
ncbi:MAG TPA: pilus (MSHA type) biogenesis protein MshL, partial [Gallionella sp.]